MKLKSTDCLRYIIAVFFVKFYSNNCLQNSYRSKNAEVVCSKYCNSVIQLHSEINLLTTY